MGQLTNNRLGKITSEAIQLQLSSIVVPYDVQFDDVCKTIRVYMRQHPEVFWFSNQYRLDESTHTLYFKYNFTPQKRSFYANEIEKAVEYLFQPDKLKYLSDLEKVAYVYKWIVNNTTYNQFSSFNQTIYSVLINRNSVCTGYAKTAQYLLGIIGVQSELVFGKFHADKSKGGRHAWNIVKIDGEWYHVDFCLADPNLKHLLNSDEIPIEHEGLLWNYYCKPTEYVLKNRSIEFIDLCPECVKSLGKRFTIKLAKAQKRTIVCKSNSGTSAKVYIDSFDKDSVIKKIHNNPHLIDNEVMMLQRLNGCKHIVQLKELTDEGIVIEQLTSWGELLNSHYYHPNESQLKDILVQLTEGLIECRDKGITYSDIHYNNVFVSKDGTYKWGDFGIAYQSTLDGKMSDNMIGIDGVALGSRWFMSPETYKDCVFTESSAIYSLAMLAYFVMNDMRPPFWDNKKEEVEILKNIHNPNIEIPAPKLGYDKLWEFLKGSCICNDFNNRLLSLSDFRDALKFGLLYSDCHSILLALKRIQSKAKLASEGKITLKASGDLVDKTINIDLPKGRLSGGEHLIDLNILNSEKDIDTDSFATTNWIDTDSYTQSCDLNPSQVSTSSPHRPESTPSACLYPARRATSFSPARDKVKSSEPSELLNRKKFGIGSIVCSALNLFGGLFTSDAIGEVNLENNVIQADDISTCLYAPSEVLPNKSFIIRVYMYLPDEQGYVDSKVKEIDPKAVKKEYKPLDLPVKIGDKLTVQLDLSDGVVCKTTSKTVVWQGHYTDCSFMAKLTDASQESIEGTAYIFVNDVPAGEMLFTIDVVNAKPRELYTEVKSHRFTKIFISYAHQDEHQVRGIAEGCRMLGKDYFFDRHTLKAGDIFKDKILNYIENADLFVLCWSKHAAESEWVKIEREYAMHLISEGKSTLSIYPLSLRPEAQLPLDMSEKYNFGIL